MDKTQALVKKFTRTEATEYEVPPMDMTPPIYANQGGVPHPGSPRGQDTTPAWLTPGEAVIPKEAVEEEPDTIARLINKGRAIQDSREIPLPYTDSLGNPTNLRTNSMLQLPPTTANVEEEVRVLRSIHGGDTEGVIQGLMANLGMTREEAIMAIRSKNDGGIVYANQGWSLLSPSTWFGGGNDSWVSDQMLDSLRGVESSNIHFDPSKAGTKGYDAKGYRLSDAGAIGAYQWMPKSAANAGYGVDAFDIYDESAQRKATRQYLEGIQRENPNWSKEDVLMAYNWGPGNVAKMKAGQLDAAQIPQEALQYSGKVLGGIPKDYEEAEGPLSTVDPALVDKLYKDPSITGTELNQGIPDYYGTVMNKYGHNVPELDKGASVPGSFQDVLNSADTTINPATGYPYTEEELSGSIFNQGQMAINPNDMDATQEAELKAQIALENEETNDITNKIENNIKDVDTAIKYHSQQGNSDAVKKLKQKKIDLQNSLNNHKSNLKVAKVIEKNKNITNETILDDADIDDPSAYDDVPPPEGDNIPDDFNSALFGDQSKSLQEIANDVASQAQIETISGNISEEQAEQKAKEAPKDWTDRITGAFKNAFSALFNEDELARMAIMYAGSRLFGYDHGGSLAWATKGYLNRIGGIEKEKQAGIKSRAGNITESMRDDYTLASIDKFIQTGNYADLIFKETGTGLVVKNYGEGKLFDNKKQKMLRTYTMTDGRDYAKIDGQFYPLDDPFVEGRTTIYQEDLHNQDKLLKGFTTNSNMLKDSLSGNVKRGDKGYVNQDLWVSNLAEDSRSMFNKEVKSLQLGGIPRQRVMQMVNEAQAMYVEDFRSWQEGVKGFEKRPRFDQYYKKSKFLINSGGKISSDMVKDTDMHNVAMLNDLILKQVGKNPRSKTETPIAVYNDTLAKLGDKWSKFATANPNNHWVDNKPKGWDAFSWWAYNAANGNKKARAILLTK